MKTKLILTAILVWVVTITLSAQNPLVGTWEYKTDSLRTIKIITPTHWAVFTETVNANPNKFVRSHGGTYTLSGDKYIENIQVASWENYGKEKTNFTAKVEGGKFYQKGTLVLGDGTKVAIDEVWEKVKAEKSFPNNLAVGTWSQLSSTSTMANGKKDSHTNATATLFQVISPSHWIRISHRNKKFENAMGGTYTAQGNKIYPSLDFASVPLNKGDKVEITQRFEGDKMYWKGILKNANGETAMTFEDVYQKVNSKPNKVAAVK